MISVIAVSLAVASLSLNLNPMPSSQFPAMGTLQLTNIATGKPLQSAEVTFYGLENNTMQIAYTNNEGYASIPTIPAYANGVELGSIQTANGTIIDSNADMSIVDGYQVNVNPQRSIIQSISAYTSFSQHAAVIIGVMALFAFLAGLSLLIGYVLNKNYAHVLVNTEEQKD